MPTAVATESVRRKYNRNARWFDSMDSPTVTEQLQAADLSPGMLERARLKPCAVPLTPHEMDAQRMTFPDATFDPSVAAW